MQMKLLMNSLIHFVQNIIDLCGVVMPSEKDNILEFNQYMKSDKCHTLFMLTLNL